MKTTWMASLSLRNVLVLLGVGAVVACGSDPRGEGDGDAGELPDGGLIADAASADAAPDAMPIKPECAPYPIPVTGGSGGQVAAQAELTSISPGASMSWNTSSGTLTSIYQLTLPLPDCTDGIDSGPLVLAALAAHPALFQIDPSEWLPPAPYNCALVSDTPQGLALLRTGIGGHEVRRDVFNYYLKRIDGVVNISAVIATYLPPSTVKLGEIMQDCDSLTYGEARTETFAQLLEYRVFFRCTALSDKVYAPQPNDTIEYADAAYWTWEESGGQALLRGFRTARLIVHPDNYTPALLDSNARCPVLDPESEDFTVGFTLTFDAQTGEFMGSMPGLDCIVC